MSQSNQSNPAQTQELTAEQRIAQLEQKLAALTTPAPSQPTPSAPVAPEEDGVYVKQWRNVSLAGQALKQDEIEQYYDAATFARMNEEVPGDEAKRTHFETLGISYKIVKDLRKSK